MKYPSFVALAVLLSLPSCGCGGDSNLVPRPPPVPLPAPFVEQVGPENGAPDVPADTQIVLDFSTLMDEGTVNDLTFILKERGGPIVPCESLVFQEIDGGTRTEATCTPAGDLLPCTTYDIAVSASVLDIGGQHLTAFASSFTTTGINCAPPPPPGPCLPQIDFGTAVSYAVLAGTTITNTGATFLDGDLGLHPGSAVTGSPAVSGVTHIADAPALQAKNDLITAYNAAVALPSTATRVGDLGGEILTAGVYTSSSFLSVVVADLLLIGGPDDVFVFQMVSSLNVGTGRKILLQGVRPCNVIWQVGSSAVLEVGVQFAGTILALTDITLKTGATAEGRLLARNGQVVLAGNTVTAP